MPKISSNINVAKTIALNIQQGFGRPTINKMNAIVLFKRISEGVYKAHTRTKI